MMLHERSSSDRSQWDSSSGEHEWTLYQSVCWMFYLYKWSLWPAGWASQWILRFILSATWMSVTNGTAWCLEPWWRCSGENILASFNHSASIIKAFWSFLVWPIFLYIWLSWIASHNVYLHCITWSRLFSFSNFCHCVDALLNVDEFLYFPVYVQCQMLNLAYNLNAHVQTLCSLSQSQHLFKSVM